MSVPVAVKVGVGACVYKMQRAGIETQAQCAASKRHRTRESTKESTNCIGERELLVCFEKDERQTGRRTRDTDTKAVRKKA